jgi:hypothetical protein
MLGPAAHFGTILERQMNSIKTIAAGLIALAALLPVSAPAANIGVYPDTCNNKEKGCTLITISGVIQPDDGEKFVQALESFAVSRAGVVLNSPGGQIMAALKIGREIKKRGFYTNVGSKGMCASACAMIWLAGAKRLVDVASRIGFHAAYLVDKKGRFIKEDGATNALVGAYYAHLGLSDEAIFYLTSAAPKQMMWLTADTAEKLGLIAEITDKAKSVKTGTKPAKSAEQTELESPPPPMKKKVKSQSRLGSPEGQLSPPADMLPD